MKKKKYTLDVSLVKINGELRERLEKQKLKQDQAAA